jgi:hypothetical protein
MTSKSIKSTCRHNKGEDFERYAISKEEAFV